ncbi:MAG: GHKL domain-containing protein [Chitinophagales bacterium]|nr:GHKL domain-containing protein [Chitinophagales bacterium]
MILSKLIAKIAGVYPNYSMEQRALNILNFSVALNCFIGGLFGIVFQMDFSYVSSQIIVSFFVYLLFLFAKRNKNIEIIAVISVILILSLFGLTYMTEGGIDGPTFGIATGYFIIFLSLSTKKTYPVFYPFAYVVALITSMALNYLHPDWVIRYSSTDQRYKDFILNFFQTIIPIYFLFISNRECYQYEQQQVEEKNKQLAIANSTKEKLFAIIGHDLRSPIASLDSLLLMLNEGRISTKDLSLHLQNIQNKTGQIRDLLDNLLYWAVSQMEHLQTKATQLLLFNIVETELSMLREQAAYKQLNIENNIAVNAIIFADNEQAKIILRNILTNAVRYTTNGGTISIIVDENQTQQKVIVTNSGKWNEEQTSTDTTDPKRTGFGLFLSKDFAKRNGGDLEIDKSSSEIVTVKWTVPKHLKNV